ncbi:hypothetical protein IW492_14105 [Enterococcus sp. BWB1-3]|uniref:hypothetical protein n=1 Tax=Enterococcus sp. BWB1-3 TaxID=2787713 RepID=UPI0019219036|nr:hypothetical protein [Enterococcus sp. BWB1-3]MBL1230366.1 hypothetical protein [Enterococcus sp. BWB1-3]
MDAGFSDESEPIDAHRLDRFSNYAKILLPVISLLLKDLTDYRVGDCPDRIFLTDESRLLSLQKQFQVYQATNEFLPITDESLVNYA